MKDEEEKKFLEIRRRVARDVFAAIFDSAADGEGGMDMDAAVDGTAAALAALFQQYVEQADDGITEEQMAEDFYKRLRALQTVLAKKSQEGGAA